MTINEALEQLQINGTKEPLTLSGSPTRMANYFKALDMAVKALEKQVEKKVIVSPYNGMKYCPICEVSVTGMHFDYCVECGQKLDWSEVD